jgi:lantibiotic modifying enzyme
MARLSFVTFDKPLAKPTLPVMATPDHNAVDAAVRRIGDRLCALAIMRQGRASWLFPTLDDRIRLSPAVVGFDLYDGLAGIALFLGALSLRTGETSYRRMAEAALAEAVAIHQAMPRERISIGAYDGAGGLAWTLAVLGHWFGSQTFTDQATEIVRRHAPFAAAEPAIDLIGGRAGFLAAGIAVAAMSGDTVLMEALRPCADSLRGLSPEDLPDQAEAGLAHGRAGVGLAMARWAMIHERSGDFDAAYDLLLSDLATAAEVRRGDVPPANDHDGRSMTAWCRGGMGVALAAIRLGRPQKSGTRDMVEAIESFLLDREAAALCPCHGALGMLEFTEAARELGTVGAAALAERLSVEIMARVLSGELCADHYHRIEAPGLMRGLAGTGYTLLRSLDPEQFPSVLTLETC